LFELALGDIAALDVARLIGRRLDAIALDQRCLRHGEDRRDRNDAERLERHPEVRALGAPDDLVQHRHACEEEHPADGQQPPTGRRQIEHLVEHDGDERAAHQQSDPERQGEQRVNDRRLDLDKKLVVEEQRQAAEHQHDYRGDDGHQRHMARHHVGRNDRSDDGNHERAGGDEQPELRVSREEDHQRTQFGGELEQRMRRGFLGSSH